MAFITLKEKMSVFEIIVMLCSFGGVAIVAYSQSNREDQRSNPATSAGEHFLSENELLTSILGCTACVMLSMSNGVMAVLTRMMQSLKVGIMMNYIAIICLTIMVIALLAEKFITGKPLRIVNYDAEQYLWGFLVAVLNIATLLFKIVAYQNERSGVITLLAFVGIVYAFLGDIFIFNEEFTILQLLGILVILVFNIALVCSKIKC